MTKLNAAGSALVYSTYLGGSGDDYGIRHRAWTAAATPTSTGYTSSTNFPTGQRLPSQQRRRRHDAFVTKLNAAGSA